MFKAIKNITLLTLSVSSEPLSLRTTADLRVLQTNGSREREGIFDVPDMP